jgi:4-amino-4-deoxy-L-arabinose transferase-like glycosyltransferase
MGALGPDEPRYTSIARTMASTGDWITPRLWGEPWFEKPALLYWLGAIGFKLGLDPDLAARIPVAIVSLAFLGFFYIQLKHEWGGEAAYFATAILGTSAGWIAFSRVAVTDLPLAAAFSTALLLALSPTPRKAALAGVFLGLAVLAKGLVPVALAGPLLIALLWRKQIVNASLIVTTCVLTAAPWYILCAWRNGPQFLIEFFWKHHFQRFSSDVLQHAQPVWFYVPVLLAAIFPWTILFAVAWNREWLNDWRKVVLLSTIIFGFVLFSASVNKLPGYLLPLIPPIAALLGIRLSEIANARWLLITVALCLAFMPYIGDLLPVALSLGITHERVPFHEWLGILLAVLVAVQCWRFDRTRDRSAAVTVIVLCASAFVLYLEVNMLPRLDASASARALWQRIEPVRVLACIDGPINRTWQYGLNFYSEIPLPACTTHNAPVRIVQGASARPILIESAILQ